MHVEFVLGLLVFATLYQLGYTCSCLPLSVSQKYCNSDFVMKVRVLSNLKSPEEFSFDAFYRVRRIRSPWKFPSGVPVPRGFRVYTASQSAACGVYLERRKKYLISGRVSENGRLSINLCGSIAEVTPLQRSTSMLKRRSPNCVQVSGPTKIKARADSKK